MNHWFRRKVIKGSQLGRKIGFPTLNLRPGSFADHFAPGVYDCQVKIDGRLYRGALHFGPKLDNKKPVLEIHVLNYSKQAYGQWVSFTVNKKLRVVKRFANLTDLRKQIEEDLKKLR